jgi:hypothetical protein
VESTAGGASSMSLIHRFLGGKAIGLALVVEADGVVTVAPAWRKQLEGEQRGG